MALRPALAVALTLCLLQTPPAPAAEVTIGGRTLVVADGFEVELVAGPPLVERPISVSFDDLGRLYVTDSAGMSDKADVQAKAKPHRVRRLEDVDGDGRFDKSIVFASGIGFPEGCLWHGGSVYVAAPPQILKLTDADGDGVAEQREVWFDGKTVTGCGNDLHGPYLGRDGWFYWCKGAFAEQAYTLPGGKPFTTRASHVFRARPDGSGIEPVLTGGMDNPVGLAFLATGERVLSCTFLQHPANGRRDGLLHAVYGGVYGKVHDVLDGHVMTGSEMPVLSHQGAAAPAGLIAGSDALFGGGYHDRLLACYFNLHKVTLHELVPDGATFTAKDTDLLSCDHPDFHPTDVVEDADGSALIVDTGGWYKVCCPTSVLAKPDVLGAIYRVRRKGQAKVEDPRGLKLAWDGVPPGQLVNRLGDARPAVRRRAVGLLRQAGPAGIVAMSKAAAGWLDKPAGLEVIWAAAGTDHVCGPSVARDFLKSPSAEHRRAASHVAGLWRDKGSVHPLAEMLREETDPAVVRAAAEALGRIGDAKAVPALLAAVGRIGPGAVDASGAPAEPGRRVLEHSLTYALMEIGDAGQLREALGAKSPHVRRAAMVALAGLPGGGLKPEDVVPVLGSGDAALAATAGWVAGRRAEWGPDLVGHFRKRLASPPLDDAARAALAGQLARLAKSPAVADLLAETVRAPKSAAARTIALRAMAEAPLSTAPAVWLDALAAAAGDPDGKTVERVVATARAVPKPKGGHAKLTAALVAVGGGADVPVGVRLEALGAAGPLPAVEPGLLRDLLTYAAATSPADVRGPAAAVLSKATLAPDQRAALADALAGVGSTELPKLLPAFERGDASESLGLRLVAALKASKGRTSLRAEVLKPVLARFPQSVRDAAADLFKPDASAAEQAAALDKLLADLPAGDVNRGQAVFVGKKAACITCHATGYLGGKLGPDLTGIGKVRTDRDLLEAIVHPSASFVRGYDPVVVILKDGDKLAGIVTSEARDEIVLATGPQETRRVPRKDVAEVRPGTVSLMPDGFGAALTKQELADVIAYLRGARK